MFEIQPKQYKKLNLNTDKLWEESVDRMMDSSSNEKFNELLDLTFENLNDSKPIEDYLNKNKYVLTPEEKLFLQISIEKRKNNDIEISRNMTNKEFLDFVDNNNISDERLKMIAQKIMQNENLTQQEVAVYPHFSEKIEQFLKK